MVKVIFIVVGFFVLATATAQPQSESRADGVISGTVIGQDGRPAKGIGLTAWPHMPLGTMLPTTKSNELGQYRFEHLQWWGKYSVVAEDDDAGYSVFSSGLGRNDPSEVELTPQHHEAEIKVYLPPKAGFLHVRLTNRRTGAEISGMMVALAPMESPEQKIFSMSCASNHTVLIPPEKNLLLHVTSDGYREWDESAGGGKPIHLASGAQLTLDIQLDPIN